MTSDTENTLGRRDMLKASVTGAAAGVLISQTAGAHIVGDHDDAMSSPIVLEAGKNRPWIGPDFWSNRFQDWRLKNGVIECLTGKAEDELRTIGLLTRDIKPGAEHAKLEAVFTPLSGQNDKGFAGFLIGVGRGKLDYRAAALAQRGAGKNGGFMAVVNTYGKVSFLDHTSDATELEYDEWRADESDYAAQSFVAGGVKLSVDITRGRAGYTVLATAYDPMSGKALSYASRKAVDDEELLGGISLLSSTQVGKDGARWSIQASEFSGDKIAFHPDRALGPVMGTLHSVADGVLKISAQFMPIGEGDPTRARLQYRKPGSSSWSTIATSPILDGYSALFRKTRWDSSKDREFRVTYPDSDETLWSGTIKKEPSKDSEMVIGLLSCISSTGISLEGGSNKSELPQERELGRFTPENFYFPHNEIKDGVLHHKADMFMVAGDQYYEHNPIRLGRNIPETKIDTLYRWYLWYWSFRDITRDVPTLMLLDDHDVLHGNIWGHAGREAPHGQQNSGGYAFGLDLAHMVHRVQASHNPDAYDPTPVLNDIPVAYTAFMYGGCSIAMVEDRKWKTTPMFGDNLDVHVSELLGERQESFLAKWKDMHPGAPKILLTASVWACPQTSPTGAPITDFDSNGYPPFSRRKAVKLVKEAGAIMLAGDQHLAQVVRHGIDDFTDGPIQFSGPAGAAYWQRWFDAVKPLPNGREGVKESGDFIDAFGNKMNVQAVANPKLTFAQFREHKKGRAQGVSDPALKTEGYGIIRVSHTDKSFTFEAWDKYVDPAKPGAKQMAGWPYRVGFDEV